MPPPAVVKLSMSQNIGAPCSPIVKAGDPVKVGTKIGDSDAFLSVPVHSSVSGTVKAIETQRSAMGGEETLVVIESDGLMELDESIRVPEINDQTEFIHAVRESGLVGLGGASFPTWLKLNPKNLIDVDTIVVNGAECEPYITSDHRTMLEEPNAVLYGLDAIMKYMIAENAYIAIEDNKPDAIRVFRERIAEYGTGHRVQVFPLKSSYPKGAERVLIYEITGKECRAGVLPADLGLIVTNVTSVAFLGHYLRTGMPLVSKRITVDGDAIAEPKNVQVPLGTTIHDLIEFCGGYKTEPKKILMGGPMMGRAVVSDQMPIIKNNNAILAFSARTADIPEESACIRCGRCHTACPFDLLPTAFADAYEQKDAKRLDELQIMQCMECGSCSYVCPAHRPLAFINKLGKAMVKEASENE